jgi:hypothetical protein
MTKVWQGIAATSKIPSPAKFFNQQNFAAGGAKAEPEKFGNLATHAKIGRTKEKERLQGAASKSLPPTQFGTKTQNFKSVKMIINYGG